MHKMLHFLLTGFLLLPGLSWAEGAHRYFDCTVNQACDAAGNCVSDSQTLTFHVAPLDANDDGSGTFILSYLDQEVTMQSLSDAGPYVWRIGNERHTLLASSETEYLWHRLTLDGSPSSTIRYLHCELRY